MKVALIVTTFNRAKYLSQTLNSLRGIEYPDDFLLIFVDDKSTDVDTIKLLNEFALGTLPIVKLFKKENKGITDSLKLGVETAISLGCDTFINLDADAIVKPNFISRLIELKKKFKEKIVSGFNSKNKDGDVLRNPIIQEYADLIEKRYCNGINMCFDKEQYLDIVKPALSSNGNWDFNTHKHTTSFIIAKPSLVEHIGIESSMGHSNNPDIAFDFYQKELVLPNITLFGIDSHDKNGIIRASEICQKNIQFGDVKIITERLFDGRDGYSVFCIKEMWKYIQTDFVLLIHSDGYIQNYKAWDDSWLQYDYIGASWGYKDNMNVGNGGFTLRSKKLLNIIKDYDVPQGTIEDDFICRKIRKELEQKHGIKFAPEEVANRFSIEAYGAKIFTDMQGHQANTYTGQFGFHGFSTIGLPIPPTPKIPTVKTPITFQKNTIPKNTHKRTFKR